MAPADSQRVGAGEAPGRRPDGAARLKPADLMPPPDSPWVVVQPPVDAAGRLTPCGLMVPEDSNDGAIGLTG
jgi:hypothetical protein